MDPLLPLHRYRLAGELTEMRADHLAFTVTEAAQLMAQHGVSLSGPDLERLTRHTEGWAAGIRLAALSLDGHPDPEQFIKEFDSEDSAITGYLVDEVLNAQSPATRKLLLRTSILDRVSADLADELTDDGQAPVAAARAGPDQRVRAAARARVVPVPRAVRRRPAAEAAAGVPGPGGGPAPAGRAVVPAQRLAQ